MNKINIFSKTGTFLMILSLALTINATIVEDEAGEGTSLQAGADEKIPIKLTVDEIMEKVREHDVSDTMEATFTMILKDKATRTEQKMCFRVMREKNNVLIRFLEPEESKGTAYLIIMDENNNPQIYLYIPPPVDDYRQIDLEEEQNKKGVSLLGSDFDVTDFQLSDPEDTEHNIIREDKIIGIDCYVIESLPKDPEYKYSKVLSWVRKDYYVPIKVEIYDHQDRLARELKVFAIKTIGKRKLVMKSQMTDLINDHKTILKLEEIKFDVEFPKDTFTKEKLGKP
jgi:outer membrane lipoprotein-sorting protein